MKSQPVFSQSRNSPHFMQHEGSLPHSQVPATCPYPVPARSQSLSPGPRLFLLMFRNLVCFFTVRSCLLPPRTTLKPEDHPLSAVRDCLFNIFAATLHIGGRSSIHNLRTRHAVVTGTHLPRRGTFNVNKMQEVLGTIHEMQTQFCWGKTFKIVETH